MDNEKKPEFLEKILKKGANKAVNENPALDKKKVLEPLKDESTNLPMEKEKAEGIVKSRVYQGKGRERGGGSSEPKSEVDNKKPVQKILEKGGQKSWTGSRSGSSGRGGGAPTVKEPDEILNEKNDVVNPEDLLSGKKEDKTLNAAAHKGGTQLAQKEQESQQQQSQHRSGFKAALDDKIREHTKQKEQPPKDRPMAETPNIAQDGIKAEIARKLDERKKSSEKPQTPKIEIAKAMPPKPITKDK